MFRREFEHDFLAASLDAEPFALVRFADGERAILEGARIKNADGWIATGITPAFRNALVDSLQCDLPRYAIGISCPCCDQESHEWYLAQVRTPLLTFSNLFVNGNYDKFLYRVIRERWLQRCLIVGSYSSADIRLPANAVNSPSFDAEPILAQMLSADRPLLVAAGPLANILIHQYWTSGGKYAALDVGSALDPILHGKPTRSYHNPNHQNRLRACRWSSPARCERPSTKSSSTGSAGTPPTGSCSAAGRSRTT